MKRKKIIQIGGTSYSGSTLLDLMLSNTENGFSCGEINALFRPYRRHHFIPECGCQSRSCRLWDEIRESGEKQVWKKMSRKFPNVFFFVDSSKDLTWFIDQGKRNYDNEFELINLLIWKTPEEYALSCFKRGKVDGWKKSYINYHRRYFSIVDKWISIKFSELVSKPQDKLQSLCDVIGIRYQAGMDEYWLKQHHTLFGSLSAKLHLYEKGSKAYVKIKNDREKYKPGLKSEQDKEITAHKSIYKEDIIKEKLPEKIRESLSSDKELDNITKILSASEVDKKTDWYRLEQIIDRDLFNWWILHLTFKRHLKYIRCRLLK